MSCRFKRKVAKSASNSSEVSSATKLNKLLECPVCLDEMRPPVKIFQCSNGHALCEECKDKPEVRSCPICRLVFTRDNVTRNILAENMAEAAWGNSAQRAKMEQEKRDHEFALSLAAETGGAVEDVLIKTQKMSMDSNVGRDSPDGELNVNGKIYQPIPAVAPTVKRLLQADPSNRPSADQIIHG